MSSTEMILCCLQKIDTKILDIYRAEQSRGLVYEMCL